MPVMAIRLDKQSLFYRGERRVKEFCKANEDFPPKIYIELKRDWHVGACAYYRPSVIKICLEECAYPYSEGQVRNWNWPGSTTDREPYGVLCHELGHHFDYWTGKDRWAYGSEYGKGVMLESGEEPISGYCPNPFEWFAEMFRLFVTNHALLKALRPKTHEILTRKFKPVSDDDWLKELGPNVPQRIVKALENKIRKVK